MKCKTEPKIQDDVCEEEGDEPEVKGGLCELLHVQVEGGQLRGELGNHLSLYIAVGVVLRHKDTKSQ